MTAPSSAPEPVISYTTQPSAACWIHCADHESSDPIHSQRNSRYESGDASQRLAAEAGVPLVLVS
jgi:hypothetical protein